MPSAVKVADTPLFDQPVAKTEVPNLTVSALTRAIRDVLDTTFAEVTVEGEITNFINHRSGHRYFTLKDEGAQIACVFWKSRISNVDLKDGQKVLCRGRITVYPPQGKYQLDVYQVRPVGIGALQFAYEKLFKKLDDEGLFDESRKRRIPQFPKLIGIVTSADGAAFHDILTVVRRRFPLCRILLRSASVQGIGAELDIAQGIRDLNRLKGSLRPDLLIVGRGGGSLEDLWCFNEEPVARAIFSSGIPVISAVGHEVDVTIADHVADLRAATPTAAAEFATPDRAELLASIADAKNVAGSTLRRFLSDVRYDLEHRIGVAAIGESIEAQLHNSQQVIDRAKQSITAKLRHYLELCTLRLEKNKSSLAALNPLNILDRGYALVRHPDGKIISSVTDFPDVAEVLLKDGSVKLKKL